jgi:hypothetical protein
MANTSPKTADSHTIIRPALKLHSSTLILNFVEASPYTFDRKSEATGDQIEKYCSLLSLSITDYNHWYLLIHCELHNPIYWALHIATNFVEGLSKIFSGEQIIRSPWS